MSERSDLLSEKSNMLDRSESDWVEGIVTRNENRIFRAALAIMGNKADAEDIIQDVFVKLIEKRPRFESPEHEVAWLVRVTVNRCKSHLRSYWQRNTVPLLESYPAKNEEQHDLMYAVYALAPKYRTVIHLFYYEGYSTKEMADITRQKESTVREQLTRARRSLKVFLEGDQS